MAKKKHSNQKLEQKSRAKLKTCFSGWIVNDMFEDFGIDLKIRFTEPPTPKPRISQIWDDESPEKNYSFPESRDVLPVSCFVQLKASEEFKGKEVAKKSLDTEWIDTYRKSSLPVVILLYEEETDNFYWEILQNFYQEELKEDLDWYSQESKQIKVPRENSFSADKEEFENPEEIARFANAVFRYRYKQIKKVHERLNPGDGYEYLNSEDKIIQYYDNSIKSADSILSLAMDKLESEEDYSDRAAERFLNKALDILEVHFDDIYFETPEGGYGLLFDFIRVFQRAKKVAKEVRDQEAVEKLEEFENAIYSEVKSMEGLHFYSKEIEEEFRIVKVDLQGSFPLPPEAWLEYEDGQTIDENLRAIAKRDEYQIVDFEFPSPTEKKCGPENHDVPEEKIRELNRREISDKDISCSSCGLSLNALRNAFGECWFSVCDVCGKVGEDFEFYVEMDTTICDECAGQY